MEEIHHHYPDVCGGCGHEFAEEVKVAGERFGRHQREAPILSRMICAPSGPSASRAREQGLALVAGSGCAPPPRVV